MEPHIQFARTPDGVSIALATFGEGPQTLVVPPPALPWSHFQEEWRIPDWKHWYEHMAEDRQIVRYDSRGSGLSQRSIDEISLDAWLLDLETVVDKLELETFDLEGFFYSGFVAIAYAAKHPERVSRLVLWSAFASQADHQRPPQVQEALNRLMDLDWELFTETLAHTLFGWGQGDPAHRLATYMREALSPELARKSWDVSEKIDVTDLLPKIQAPTLVLHRPEFAILSVDAATKLCAGIPNARLTLLEGTSLAPYIGDDEQGLKAIEQFLSDDDTAEPGATHDHAQPAARTVAAGGGAAHAHGGAGGFRTILFTDMEGSTAATQRLGDAEAQGLVRVHNQTVRAALLSYRGTEIKHTGDGIMASFPGATLAVEAAVAMQLGFVAHNDAHPEARLAVRIGVNAGEPVDEDEDLFGTAVQLASRVCAQGGPDEILVSDVVRQLVAGKGFLFADRGEMVLRGFEDPVRIYEVRWRDA